MRKYLNSKNENKVTTILKAFVAMIGILISSLIGLAIILIIGITLYFSFSGRNYDEIIQLEEFIDLQQFIEEKGNFSNFAILPRDSIFVYDGTIINLRKKTFGKEPQLGFYANYYEESIMNNYSSIDSLLFVINPSLNINDIQNLLNMMALLEIEDIFIPNEDKGIIIYRWEVSAMWGEEGIVYSKNNNLKNLRNFNWTTITQLQNTFYEFYN